MKKFVSVVLASGLILSLAGCSSNTNESIADEQTNVTVSESVSETDSENTVATSTETVTVNGWEYSLEGMSDEEVADLVFNTINGFHTGMSLEEWHELVGVMPVSFNDALERSFDYTCQGYVLGTYPSEDYISSIGLDYIVIDDNGLLQLGSSSSLSQVEIDMRIVDTTRAQNIYTLLKAKFAAVTDNNYHEDEDEDDNWQTYASGDGYSEAWRVAWYSDNEESIQMHENGMSENYVTVQAFVNAYPGMT